MSAELSGRVTSLENQMTAVQQDLLQKPDIAAYSQLGITWNQQYTEVYNSVQQLQTLVRALQTTYANLYYNLNALTSTVTGHTGQLLTGTNPAHSGAS